MAKSLRRANALRWLLFLCLLLAGSHSFIGSGLAARELPRPAPEFTHPEPEAWLNSRPMTLVSERGKVVLIDFWTFDCWNCHRSFVWLNELERRLADRKFLVIGVHTPEFEHERDKGKLEEKVKLYGLRHPIMIDNDFSYWNAVGSRYWPSFFAIDKQGMIRAVFVGQTDPESPKARQIEQTLETLLAE